MSSINGIVGWISYFFFNYCWKHKRKLEVYATAGYDEIEYVECRECMPEYFVEKSPCQTVGIVK